MRFCLNSCRVGRGADVLEKHPFKFFMVPKLSLVLISIMISADVNDSIKMNRDDINDLY